MTGRWTQKPRINTNCHKEHKRRKTERLGLGLGSGIKRYFQRRSLRKRTRRNVAGDGKRKISHLRFQRRWSAVGKVFDPLRRDFESIRIIETPGHSATSRLHFGIHQSRECFCDGSSAPVLSFKPIAYAKALYARRVVDLVEGKWQNELRYAGGQRFGGRPYSTMMHD